MQPEITKKVSGTSPSIDWRNEVVLPRYTFELRMKENMFLCPTADHFNHRDWLALDANESEDTVKSADPCSVIRQLLLGRLHAPPYPWTGELDEMPFLTAQETLELVGVGSATAFQVQLCTSTLRGLLGKPKKYRGRDRWLILPREDDSCLSKRLARKYPVPDFHPFDARLHTRDIDWILERNLTLFHARPAA